MQSRGIMHDERNLLPVHDPRRVDRVRSHTAPGVLAEIDRKTATRVMRVARGGHDAIVGRLSQLDREWDIERMIALSVAGVSILADVRGRRGGLAWGLLRRTMEATLLGHALLGRSPLTALLRRIGIRTQKEIDAERAVLVELLRLMEADQEDETFVVIEEAQIVQDPATATR